MEDVTAVVREGPNKTKQRGWQHMRARVFLHYFLFVWLVIIGMSSIIATGGGGGGGGESEGSTPPPTLSSIAVTPANPSVPSGFTQQFTATGTYSDGTNQNITTQVTWGSSNTSVATINTSGLATPVAAGTATITATLGSVSGSTTLTVPSLSSLSVTPANPSVFVGITQQFTATGTYSDGTNQNITTQVTWGSSNTSVATINTSGLAQGVAIGSSVITATLGNVSGNTSLTVTTSGGASNVLSVTVNGSLCSSSTSSNYPNKPCVSVEVCTHGTSNCQTIDDVLLDTGSYGLRIFSNVLTVPLTQVPSGAGSLAECAQFGSGSTWGPVQLADIILGNEPAVEVPVQVINVAGFARAPGACPELLQTPADAGFSAILGVGPLTQDCPVCVTAAVPWYYSCTGSTCSATTVPPASQVQNPVALLPRDNNGIIVELPPVPSTGSPSVDGYLVLGINTQANNAPSAVTAYQANSDAEFTTTFQGTSYPYSFIDSGSNGFFFPDPAIPVCQQGVWSGWFCPTSTQNLLATTTGASGSPTGTVSFQIANPSSFLSTGVFNDLGASAPDEFDWGLPFFLGRNVYVGFQGMASPLGTGPYWAY